MERLERSLEASLSSSEAEVEAKAIEIRTLQSESAAARRAFESKFAVTRTNLEDAQDLLHEASERLTLAQQQRNNLEDAVAEARASEGLGWRAQGGGRALRRATHA